MALFAKLYVGINFLDRVADPNFYSKGESPRVIAGLVRFGFFLWRFCFYEIHKSELPGAKAIGRSAAPRRDVLFAKTA